MDHRGRGGAGGGGEEEEEEEEEGQNKITRHLINVKTAKEHIYY
jgi:hypothetical protein